jgi:hypothetical protein
VPLEGAQGLPLVTSKTAPSLSLLPEARYLPEPREKASDWTTLVWPLRTFSTWPVSSDRM